jgi:hypothetical protein
VTNNANKVAFFLFTCLAMTVFTVTGANAQSQATVSESAQAPGAIELADMPGGIAGYTPHSGIYKGTMGTIGSDVDAFMSVLDFSAVKMQNWFSYAGIDENGVNLGYATKFGPAYLGVSYGGSLIDEILRRITNQDILTLQKREEITKTSSETMATPGLVDSEGETIEGITTSENAVNLIFGIGGFGLKLGFSAYLEGREMGSKAEWDYEQAFESSLKPSLELGWNFPIGSVRTKIALRGAYDMHQYISLTGEPFLYHDEVNNTIVSQLVDKEVYRDFTEPSGGFTLGFEFGLGGNTRAEFDLIGDLAYRIYRNNEQDGVMTGWEIRAFDPVSSNQLSEEKAKVTAPEIFDLRFSGNPVFTLQSDISDKLTIGAKMSLAIGYDAFTVSQTRNNLFTDPTTNADYSVPDWTVKLSDSRTSVTPELGIGAKFTLWPDHFSMYAGFGIDLFSYNETISTRTVTPIGGVDEEITNTTRTLDLPTTKLTAGLALNLTSTMALDLLAITSGLDIDTTKLTLLLTLSK